MNWWRRTRWFFTNRCTQCGSEVVHTKEWREYEHCWCETYIDTCPNGHIRIYGGPAEEFR